MRFIVTQRDMLLEIASRAEIVKAMLGTKIRIAVATSDFPKQCFLSWCDASRGMKKPTSLSATLPHPGGIEGPRRFMTRHAVADGIERMIRQAAVVKFSRLQRATQHNSSPFA